MDGETLAFHRRVHEGYHRLIDAEPGRWVVLDAAREVEVVQAEVLQIVLARLDSR